MKFVPTTRFAGLAVVLACVGFVASVAGVPETYSFSTVAVVALVVAIWDGLVGTSHSLLTVTRRHPPVVALGAVSKVEWEIRSDAKRPLRVMVADELAPSLRADIRRFAITVPSGSTVEVSTRIEPTRRGRFDISTMTVRIVGRFGLMARQRDVPLTTVLRVHPRFRSKDEAELRIKRARVLEVGTRSATGFGGGTDFEQMKEYLPDDEYRRIDWTATARVGRPVVRTYRAEKNQSVLVLLDNGRVQAGLIEGVPRVEYSMDAAMMLTTVATRLGDHCGLVGFDSQIRTVLAPSRHRDQVSQVAEAMYNLDPELAESDYSGAFSFAAARFRRRMLIVLLTDIVDHSISGALLPALPTLSRKHIVLVAAIRDPQLEQWARPTTLSPPDNEADGDMTPEELISRRISAMNTLRSRELSIAKLRNMGATVIDTSPDRLASELGDAYLMIKGTGRL
ncbi:MAG: DUF58 domain-containing protein [Microthrixaceae bacterium]|nr:DUF58 domain-containing protein [Microthrixaceae bacterium]